MNINFYLKDESADKSAIRLVITHRGKIFRKNIGISVSPEHWRKPKRGKQYSTDPKIQTKLRKIDLQLSNLLSEDSTYDDIVDAVDAVFNPGKTAYERMLDRENRQKKSAKPTFWEYFDEWADRPRSTKRFNQNAKRRIAEMMGREDDWKDIDSAWFFKLNQRMNEAGYSVNYKATIVARLKTVMSEGFKLKYHANLDYQTFKKVQEPVDTVYLSQAEVDALWNLDLPLSIERKARDLFIIGVYTASRYSDYSRLRLDDIEGGMIRFVQKKTSGSVVIPAAPRVIEVLERNGGAAPVISQQQYNKNIKVVCRKAGMTGTVLVTRSSGLRHITERKHKWELVSSHTARRTGATLLYMSGVPLRQCMLITGHTTEATFMKYIRVTKEENADLLASNPFFNAKV